ncbi:disease resistance protein PIK6-NP-like [Oryza glaberrima]|uniref:AAA+ ATPase domain-containing protein n=2 Tax=Oryza TaxID=4527 RepID=A0A0D3FM72_9ORYZ|nr:disease resistance protein PIK6-NP-like [Oryza glaberrima]
MAASTGVVSSLLSKLATMAEQKYGDVKRIRREITFLTDELSSMNALLLKLADMEELDPQLKEWRNKVRELAYDVEDCIDALAHHHRLSRGDADLGGLIRRAAHNMKKLRASYRAADQIHELKARIMEVSDRRLRYKLDEAASAAPAPALAIDPRLPALFAESKGLVGIEGPRSTLVSWLMDGEGQLKVISIVGFGGLGKTTLAKEVNHAVGAHFQLKAFVSVSRNLNPKKLICDVLSQIMDQKDYGKLEVEQLIPILRKHLADKRYLIIIDDIWRIQAWDLVKSALPDNSCQSRIITTTRISTVAESCCSTLKDRIYYIEPLNEVESRELFFKRIFATEHGCPPHLEEVSNEILKKCGGLPLAILSIASSLANKPDIKEQWEMVKKSIGFALEGTPTLEGMNKILLFSYYDLPTHLKACLLYLSIFPEDYVIASDKLVWRWMSEGLIVGEMGQNLEQAGQIYFNELINRSMIEPVGVRYDGKVLACRVHDMVLDMIISLSAQENFVTILHGHEDKFAGEKIRRLSLRCNRPDVEVTQVTSKKFAQARSISLFGYKEMLDLQGFQALRVLDLGQTVLFKQVKNIGKCYQLKYLDLSDTDIVELPEEIGNVQSLETLDLRNCRRLTLPSTIAGLRKLVRLLVDYTAALPEEISGLVALQVLSCASYNSVKFMRALGQLTELRSLAFKCWNPDWYFDAGMYKEVSVASLRELGKHKLQYLDISDDDAILDALMCSSSESDCPFPHLQKLVLSNHNIQRIPRWIGSLVNLSHLEIAVKTTRQNDLGTLGNLPCLLYLKICRLYEPIESLIVPNRGFRCLKELCFQCWCPLGLEFARGAMPWVQTFRLWFMPCWKSCDHGVSVGLGIEHLLELKLVDVETGNGCGKREVKSFEAAITAVVANHPRRPALVLRRSGERSAVRKENWTAVETNMNKSLFD